MMRSSDHEIDDIAAVLRSDASLSSDIIRMSNSSYYGFTSPLNSLDEALKRVGLKEAQRVINMSLAKSLYSKALVHYQLSAYHFWARSANCGALMERIAKDQTASTSEAYTIGSLHLLGKVVINTLMREVPIGARWDGQQPDFLWEREHTELDYAKAGADLLTRWKFPETIIEPIAHHLEPDENASLMTQALAFSVQILEQTGSELKNDLTSLPDNAPALGMDETKTIEIIEASREQFITLREALGIQ